MSYNVALLNFEGPLHLLLQLIEQSELAITEISLAEVTGQYLEYVNQLHNLDPAELNQFIDLAARLIHIKSQALLPTLAAPELEEDISELTAQLAEYQRYQKATEYLNRLLKSNATSWSRPATVAVPERMPLPTIQLPDLQQAFNEAMARLPEAVEAEYVPPAVTIEQMMDHITASVRQRQTSVKELLAGLTSRVEAVVMFLGLLELIRHKTVSVAQETPFSDIMVMYG
jgi:segregation and condensation protein A